MKRIVYLGWLGRNNLGDELMWEIFQHLSRTYLGTTRYKIIPALPGTKLNKINYDMIVLGGGSLISKLYIKELYKAVRKKKKIIIWGSGIDRISKSKMEVLHQSGGKRINDLLLPKTQQKLAAVIKHANYIGVRGPLTYHALRHMDVDMKKVHISGDSGLLLTPSEENSLPEEANLWKDPINIIAVNWGTTFNNIYGNDEMGVEDQLVSACKELISKGYKIYIYTVWDKDIEANKRFYRKIGDEKNVRLSTTLYKQEDLMKILQKCIFTINFKLHANIISAVASVPFIALGHRFKVFDFAKSIDLDQLVIPTDSPSINLEIQNLEEYIKENRGDIIDKMIRYRRKFTKRLIKPFQKRLYFHR